MWIQLPAAFVCSDKSSYVQGLSLSDFNQFSGDVCGRYRSGLAMRQWKVCVYVYVCEYVCVLDACAQACLWESQNTWVIETVKEWESTKAFHNSIHLKRNLILHQTP